MAREGRRCFVELLLNWEMGSSVPNLSSDHWDASRALIIRQVFAFKKIAFLMLKKVARFMDLFWQKGLGNSPTLTGNNSSMKCSHGEANPPWNNGWILS